MKIMEIVDGIVQGANEMKSEIVVFGQEQYNTGFEAGKAAIQLPDAADPEAKYTQAQMSDAVTVGMTQQRLKDEVEFGTQIADLNSQLKSLGETIELEKAKAVSAAKTELQRAYAEAQSAEAKIESDFGESLKNHTQAAEPAPVDPAPASDEVAQPSQS